jgi:hypothetical protein
MTVQAAAVPQHWLFPKGLFFGGGAILKLTCGGGGAFSNLST